MNESALKQYRTVGVHGGVLDASPHELISMLMAGALDRVASAKGAIDRGDIGLKGELLSSALAIIDNLRASLDYERGGEIAGNLGSLYDYIEQGLVTANMESDGAKLNEIGSLLAEIKSGWETIPEDMRRDS